MTEREQIVAWLREEAGRVRSDCDAGHWGGAEMQAEHYADYADYLADHIERGDHIPPETD